MSRSDVHTSAGISCSSPAPSFFATTCVSARPTPRSNKLAYPVTAHASVRTPKRSVPMFRIKYGTTGIATNKGAPVPRRFQIVFLASRRPLVRCTFPFAEVSVICDCVEPLRQSFQACLFYFHGDRSLDQCQGNHQAPAIISPDNYPLKSCEGTAAHTDPPPRL